MVQLSERFVPIKLNGEKDGKAAAGLYHVDEQYPVILFVTGDGEVVSRLTGFYSAKGLIGEMQKALDSQVDIGALEEALKANPGDAQAMAGLGSAYARKGDWKSAMEMADRAMAVDPKNADDKFTAMYNAIGDMFQASGKPFVAMEYFNRSAASGRDAGKVAHALLGMGACYLQVGMRPEAGAMAERALGLQGLSADDKKAAEELKKGSG